MRATSEQRGRPSAGSDLDHGLRIGVLFGALVGAPEVHAVYTTTGRFDRLERDGLLDSSILIVTSDHGEAFGVRGVDHTALYRGGFKAIHLSDGRFEVYDRGADAGERQDLGPTRSRLARELRSRVTAWLEAHSVELESRGAGPDADEKERLRALGYLD